MHRFYIPPGEARGESLTLTGREAHHALHVLRVREGERVLVLDGAGRELSCDIIGTRRDAVSLRALESRTIPAPECARVLLLAIPKGKIIESVIQKATELGVSRVVPLLSERVVTHLDSESAEAKTEKWQQVAVEAIKQCGAAWLAQVEAPVRVPDLIARGEQFELPLVACLEPGSRHPRVWFDEFHDREQRGPRSVAVWVGPEGDFTSAEYGMIRDAGARPITLGPLVLRVETAATYCLSVVNYELSSPRG